MAAAHKPTSSAPPAPAARDAHRNRRARNVAIGLAVAGFVVLIYAITIVKLGPAILRPV